MAAGGSKLRVVIRGRAKGNKPADSYNGRVRKVSQGLISTVAGDGAERIPKLIEGLNRHLKGWGNYFKYGYPRDAFREINRHVGQRLFRHLNRRSQRAFRLPEATTYYRQFRRLGLKPLEI